MDLIRFTLTMFVVILVSQPVPAPPTCERINLCHGEVTYTSSSTLDLQTHANVTCDVGYTLNGYDNVTCVYNVSLSRAIWFPEEPVCDVNECGSISLENGVISYTQGKEYGSAASFTCLSGYELSGEASITCQEDENWSDAVPTCEGGAGDLKHSLFLITASLALLFFKSE